MRIATWNLESVRSLTPERKASLRKAMRQVAADAWVLTETWSGFSPGEGYELVAQSSLGVDLGRWPDRRWVAIWSRCGGTEVQVQSQPDRMTCARIENPGGRDLLVLGTVLPWRSDRLYLGASGFCRALDNQVTEWQRILAAYPDPEFVVAGDFNQSLPYEPPYGTQAGGKAFADALQIHGVACLTQGSDPVTSKPRIDHICIRRDPTQNGLIPVACSWNVPKLNGKPVTDHSGAYADLDFAGS